MEHLKIQFIVEDLFTPCMHDTGCVATYHRFSNSIGNLNLDIFHWEHQLAIFAVYGENAQNS